MGLTIDLPSAGLLGITNASAAVITGTATLAINSVNALSGSGTYTVDVQDSYQSGQNNSFQLRQATLVTRPVGNSNWNPQGDGSPRTNFVNQDFWTTGQGGGNNPNVPSPQNLQNN